MLYTGVYHIASTAPVAPATPVVGTIYRRPIDSASIGIDGVAPYNTPVSGRRQPKPNLADRKLLDQFRDQMRSLHFAGATGLRVAAKLVVHLVGIA
jgi:hypothetical protein